MITRFLCCVFFVLCALAPPALGVITITRSVVGGGAIGGAGATYTVHSTLGQPAISVANATTHGVRAGFWFGVSATSGVPPEEAPVAVPSVFALFQNAPNPFNPKTAIAYDVPLGGGHVRLSVYDIGGRLVTTLVDQVEEPGRRSVEWTGTDSAGRALPCGIYVGVLEAPGFRAEQKMVILK